MGVYKLNTFRQFTTSEIKNLSCTNNIKLLPASKASSRLYLSGANIDRKKGIDKFYSLLPI